MIADRHEAAAELLGAHEQFQELYGVKAPLGLEQLLDAQDPTFSPGRLWATMHMKQRSRAVSR